MDRTPTYVIGVGDIGVEAVSELQGRQTERDGLGLMAIDTRQARLDAISGVPTLHLRSETGLLGDRAAGYPFLASDVYVPRDGAAQRRHIGRYKLDNAVSPSFSSHRQSISAHLEAFINNIENSLDQIPGTYNVVLVSSMADGTGSGTFPLLSALLQDLTGNLGSGSRRIHLCYLGVVPSLDDRDTSTEPWAYANTLAALRNLDTLLAPPDGRSLTLPVYSRQRSDDGGEPGTTGRHLVPVETPVFDACWLVERAHDGAGRGGSPEGGETLATVCDGLHSLLTNTPTDHEPLDPGSSTSALGTFGYACVAVPHERVGRFCALKTDRDDVERRLEEYVHPKLDSLRARKKELESTLGTELQASRLDDWVGCVSAWLDSDPEAGEGLVDGTEPDRLEATLNRFLETDVRTYLLAARATRHELSERGEAGATVLTEVRQTLATLHTTHRDELSQDSTGSVPVFGSGTPDRRDLERAATRLERELKQARTDHRERLAAAEFELRELLPLRYGPFTSTREQLSRDIDRITQSLRSLESVTRKLEALHELRTIARRHEDGARALLGRELEGVEADISHFRAESDHLQERHQSLTRQLNTERQRLIRPRNTGSVRFLPLRYEELQTVTPEEHSEELTSLQAYRDRGLIDDDREGIRDLLRDCYRESRDWPPSVARHDRSVPIDSVHESTFVLHHEDNHRFVGNLGSEFTEPDTIRSSAESATCFLNDPFRVEIISLSHGGQPSSLDGFRRLTEWERSGDLRDLATIKYDDYNRAIAYPEWYSNVEDPFE